VYGAEVKNLKWWATGPRKTFDDIFSPVVTMHERVGRTDRRTYTGRQQRQRLRIALRGKNKITATSPSKWPQFIATKWWILWKWLQKYHSRLGEITVGHCCKITLLHFVTYSTVTDGKGGGHVYIFRWSFLRMLCKKNNEIVRFAELLKNWNVYFFVTQCMAVDWRAVVYYWFVQYSLGAVEHSY